MGYLVLVAEKFLNPDNDPDYIKPREFPINTTDIYRIMCAMNDLGFDVWWMKNGRKIIYKSPLFQKIEQDRIQRRVKNPLK